MNAADPLFLARELIRRPSVTPDAAGTLDFLQGVLEPLGFRCRRLVFGGEGEEGGPVDNLYARLGASGPHLCFAGHVDVVPPGDAQAWSVPPFEGRVKDGLLYGRGACDMKGGVACAVAAVAQAVASGPPEGSLSFLVTSDEEGEAVNGTAKAVAWLAEEGERIDACVVGEPTNPDALGDAIKVGRRGSLNGLLTVRGRQGHTAYPDRADNPLPRLLALLAALREPLDSGTDAFEPSRLEITSVDVGNPARNVIPGRAVAAFNVRFNDTFTASTLEAELRRRCETVGGTFELACVSNAEAFTTPPGPLADLVAEAVERVVGRRPAPSTAGGTSDARFIRDIAPVVEFGLVGQTMHAVDERVPVDDLLRLTLIYREVIRLFFSPP